MSMLSASSFINLLGASKFISSIFPVVWRTLGFILSSFTLRKMINSAEVVKCQLDKSGGKEKRISFYLNFVVKTEILVVTKSTPRFDFFSFWAFCANAQ